MKTLSKEHKKKLSLAKIGIKGIGMTGMKHSQEAKIKMRLSRLGVVPWNKGIKNCYSKEILEKMKKSRIGLKKFSARDENAWNWKGDKGGIATIHIWVKRRKPKPQFCEHCNKVVARDLANIGHTYHRNIEEYLWLCRKCHMIQDGRIKKTSI